MLQRRMHKLIEGAALLFVLFGAVHALHNPLAISHFRNIHDLHRDKIIAKRQQINCTLDNYPDHCAAAVAAIDSGSGNVQNALSDFCTHECVQPYVDYSNCVGFLQAKTYYNNLVCGKNGNQYCGIIYDEDSTIEDDIECVPVGGTCNASCSSMQENVVSEWGCCAATYYAVLEATCDVGAGDVCDGGVVDAGIVNRAGLGLIMIFAMVAAFANAILFSV